MKIDNVKVYELEETIKACKLPMATDVENIDTDDKRLKTLANTNSNEGHDNALCGILVAFNLTCSNKMWVEFERYHFANIVSSQSTMHRITKFDLDKCLNEYADHIIKERLKAMVKDYDGSIEQYLRILYSTPSGLELTARVNTNYRQLKTMYIQRKNHRLPEWRQFCEWIKTLPMSELITNGK